MKPTTYLYIAVLLLTSLACNPESRQTVDTGENKALFIDTSGHHLSLVGTGNRILKEEPKDKRIHPAPVRVKPKILSFEGETKAVSANPNVELAVVSKVVRVPKELPVTIPGKNGIPAPDTVVARFEPIHIATTPPIPASPLAFKESASRSIQYLGREQGLELESVTSMLEDKRGHIWFGCQWRGGQGLSRYDGLSFTHFSIGAVGPMLEDRNGRLWFGTDSGLMFYDGNSFAICNREQGLGGIRSMLEDSRGNLWFGGRNGLNRYDPDAYEGQGSFIQYPSDQGLRDNRVWAITEDKTGNLWFGNGNGLNRYDPDAYGGQGSFTQYPSEEGLGGKAVNSILVDKRGDLWFGGRKGLARYDPDAYGGQGSFTYYKIKGSSNYIVFDMLEDSLGNLWIGHEGLSRFEPDEVGTGGKFTHFTAREGLNAQTVWSLLLDTQGNIWAGLVGEE